MKNLLLFIPRLIASTFLSIAFIVCFIFAWALCIIGLIVFAINYKNLKSNGSGIFHKIFFKLSGLYYIEKAFRIVWNID